MYVREDRDNDTVRWKHYEYPGTATRRWTRRASTDAR